MNLLKITLTGMIFSTSLLSYEVSDYIDKTNCDRLINKQVYDICYDYDYKGATSVDYVLDGTKVNFMNIKKRPKFYSEKNLKSKYKTKTSDYTYTGLDRGHVYSDASADWDQKVLNKVYTMANIIPQYPNVNRDIWFKGEEYERSVAYKLGSLNVVNIIVYDNPKNYLKRMPLEKAMKDYPKFNWNNTKQSRYLNDSKKLIKKKIVIPSGFIKVFFNTEADFEKCFYWENDPNANSESDRLKNHVIDCKEVVDFK